MLESNFCWASGSKIQMPQEIRGGPLVYALNKSTPSHSTQHAGLVLFPSYQGESLRCHHDHWLWENLTDDKKTFCLLDPLGCNQDQTLNCLAVLQGIKFFQCDRQTTSFASASFSYAATSSVSQILKFFLALRPKRIPTPGTEC